MAKLRQGQVHWANLPPPAGRRPVLVLTRSDAVNQLSGVTVAPLSRTIRHLDSEVILTPDLGLPSLCAVSLDSIVTLPRTLLDQPLLALDDQTMSEVFAAIRFTFAMA